MGDLRQAKAAFKRGGKIAPHPAQRFHRIACQQPQPPAIALQPETQYIQHGICHIGTGIDLAVRLRNRFKAQSSKEIQRIFNGKAFQRKTAEFRMLSVIASGRCPAVCKVAAAVAGGKQLAAKAGLPLRQQHSAGRVLQRRQRCHHARCAAAHNEDSPRLTHGAAPPAACGSDSPPASGWRPRRPPLFCVFLHSSRC